MYELLLGKYSQICAQADYNQDISSNLSWISFQISSQQMNLYDPKY